MRNRDPLLNKIIGKYAKSDINENGEKLIELCNLHNLRITNTIFKHKPTHQTTWTSPAPYKNVTDSKIKSLQKNPYRNQIDDILVRNYETIKMTDSKSTTNKTTMSDHNPDIMKTTIVLKKHCKIRKIQQIDYRRLRNISNVQENYKSTIDKFNDISYEIINSQQKWNTITDILKESAKTNVGYIERSKRSESVKIVMLSDIQRNVQI